MSCFHAFVGPYLEILAPLEIFPADIDWSDADYESLFTSSSRLRWINGRSDPKPVEIEGRMVWQHCGFPEQEYLGVPRWPMYFRIESSDSGANGVLDLRGADIPAELTWFEEAFAVELDIVRRAAESGGFEYGLRWGMVCYVY